MNKITGQPVKKGLNAMTEEKRAILKKRFEIIQQIRARDAARYNYEGVKIRNQIIPRCKSCECSSSGVCKAALFWNVAPDFERDAPITDEDNVCIYWSPNYTAYTEGRRKAGL